MATMKAWRTHEYGEPKTALKLDTVDIPEPGPGELLIKNQGIPLNLNDLERIRGGNMMAEPQRPYSPGMEVMGIVDKCGPGTEAWAGKRVVATTKGAHGGFAEYSIVTAGSTFDMPDSVPFPDAAALYFPFHLAWIGLYERGGLKAGETVLIHAAAGGAGSAAIQLAVARGAKVFATAGSDDKLKLCRDLGAAVAINYKTEDFTKIVLEQTAGKGVDMVFDNVGEAVMQQSFKAIGYNGRYMMMGFASNKVVVDEKFLVPRQLSMGNFDMRGVLLSYAPDQAVAMMKAHTGWNFAPHSKGAEITKGIVDLYTAGKIKAVIGSTVDFSQVPQAFEAMAASKTTGRTVVRV
ncbi:MAG TPA: zinc-binding dehydrogenase [Alphaproteobacteria bacterium]|nr:zinc-binding dehydrogenase [Alphaproteobacteria bacterium]